MRKRCKKTVSEKKRAFNGTETMRRDVLNAPKVSFLIANSDVRNILELAVSQRRTDERNETPFNRKMALVECHCESTKRTVLILSIGRSETCTDVCA